MTTRASHPFHFTDEETGWAVRQGWLGLSCSQKAKSAFSQLCPFFLLSSLWTSHTCLLHTHTHEHTHHPYPLIHPPHTHSNMKSMGGVLFTFLSQWLTPHRNNLKEERLILVYPFRGLQSILVRKEVGVWWRMVGLLSAWWATKWRRLKEPG